MWFGMQEDLRLFPRQHFYGTIYAENFKIPFSKPFPCSFLNNHSHDYASFSFLSHLLSQRSKFIVFQIKKVFLLFSLFNSNLQESSPCSLSKLVQPGSIFKNTDKVQLIDTHYFILSKEQLFCHSLLLSDVPISLSLVYQSQKTFPTIESIGETPANIQG